jgi:hypothetical protein
MIQVIPHLITSRDISGEGSSRRRSLKELPRICVTPAAFIGVTRNYVLQLYINHVKKKKRLEIFSPHSTLLSQGG